MTEFPLPNTSRAGHCEKDIGFAQDLGQVQGLEKFENDVCIHRRLDAGRSCDEVLKGINRIRQQTERRLTNPRVIVGPVPPLDQSNPVVRVSSSLICMKRICVRIWIGSRTVIMLETKGQKVRATRRALASSRSSWRSPKRKIFSGMLVSAVVLVVSVVFSCFGVVSGLRLVPVHSDFGAV